MQLTLDTVRGLNTVSALERGRLRIGNQWHSGSLVISRDAILPHWSAVSAADLSWKQLEPLLALEPEIILIGAGDSIAFPPASVSARVLQMGIGFESMDTAAACRTFNILVAEQRRVVAGILQPHP